MKLSLSRMIMMILATTLVACDSSFLEQEPLANADADSYYYQSETTANEAVLGIYTAFYRDGLYKRNIWIAEEVGSDNAYFHNEVNQVDVYNVQPGNGDINAIWTNHFDLINRSVHVIKKIPDTPIATEKINALLGEAYFLQSLAYFNLVRYFGGVPVIYEIPNTINVFELPRNTEAEVYEYMIRNLTEYSIPYLPAVNASMQGSSAGRATKAAAQTLLADIYLTLAGKSNDSNYYQKVVDLTGDVMGSGLYSLEEDYAMNFYLTSENGKESIFEIQNANIWDRGGQEFQWWANHGGGWGNLAITDDLLDAFNASNIDLGGGTFLEDYRGDITILEKGEQLKNDPAVNSNQVHRPQKYVDMPGSMNFFLNSAQNTKVYRYAEVLLMRAEALNKLNLDGALELVNMIRRRAFQQPIDVANPTVDVNGMSQSDLDLVIFNERRLEFALESKRWHDLVRTGRAVTILNDHSDTQGAANKTFTETSLLFPIPQATVNHYPAWTLNPANSR